MNAAARCTLMVVGGLLVLAPLFGSQWRLSRIEAFYAERGEGSRLPDELKSHPFSHYEWSCLGVGVVLIGIGAVVRREGKAAKR